MATVYGEVFAPFPSCGWHSPKNQQRAPCWAKHRQHCRISLWESLWMLQTLTSSFRIMSVGLSSSLIFPDKKRDKKEIAEEKKRIGRERGGGDPRNKQQRGSCVQFPAACCFDHHVLSDAPIERRVEHGHESKPVFLSALGLMRSACRNVGSTPSPRGLLQDRSEGTMPFFSYFIC